MRWYGKRDIRVEEVPDPAIEQPNDAIVRVTSTGICGSDLHLYEVLGAREPLRPGDRVVVPFKISCGHCWMCRRLARRHGIEVVDAGAVDDVPGALIDATAGPGPDSVIDAVVMEAEGSRVAALAQKVAARLPDALGKPMAEEMGVDRLSALTDAIATVRRGGTISITGVYGGAIDPLPMMDMFDKGIQLRMGQTHVRRWLDDLLPLLLDDADPAGTGDLASHYLPLEQAGRGYEVFQRKDEAAPRWCCSRAAPSRRYTRVPAVP